MSERNVVYVGRRVANAAVVVIEEPDVRGLGKPLDPRFDLRSHSPTGFEWGYGGSGPSQLALAILADHFGHQPNLDEAKRVRDWISKYETGDELALMLYQGFKGDFITGIETDHWEITSQQIRLWCLNV